MIVYTPLNDILYKLFSPLYLFLLADTSLVQVPSDKIAFYAYLSQDTPPNLPVSYILKFDTIKLNLGQGYSQGDGIFTVPRSGVYVFTWTIAVSSSGWSVVDIVLNGEVVGAGNAHAPQGLNTGTGVVVVYANVGDHVYMRLHENGYYVINSNARGRSSFSGWLLF